GEWTNKITYLPINCGSVAEMHELLIDITVSCTDSKCLNPVGADKMEPLTLKYGVLVHLTNKEEPEILHCPNAYDCTAQMVAPAVTPVPDPGQPGGEPEGGTPEDFR
ncbi:hypothetical protein KY320_03235, partial [Candidatus Woesearchaeota archaeon]|nr:hypothetical protein [Candidatus Woesearchaeota archaeon]